MFRGCAHLCIECVHCVLNYLLKSTKENLPAAPDSAICLKYKLSNSSLLQHEGSKLGGFRMDGD